MGKIHISFIYRFIQTGNVSLAIVFQSNLKLLFVGRAFIIKMLLRHALAWYFTKQLRLMVRKIIGQMRRMAMKFFGAWGLE